MQREEVKCSCREIFLRNYMALNIRNPEAEALAADLASLTGESKTEAVVKALRQRVELVRSAQRKRGVAVRLDEIAKHCAYLPVLDRRTADEMLYDDRGLPH